MNDFREILRDADLRSDDPHTQVSCVITDKEDRIIVIDSNRATPGVILEDWMLARPEKYDWIEHAERNAIFNAARVGFQLQGCTMYLNSFPCVECSRAIAVSGISTLYHGSIEGWDEERYKFKKSRKILEAAGVKLIEYGMTDET